MITKEHIETHLGYKIDSYKIESISPKDGTINISVTPKVPTNQLMLKFTTAKND